MDGQSHAPVALTPERPDILYIEGWVGPRADLDGSGKTSPPTGIRSSDRPARSVSLYRLSYPGLPVLMKHVVNKNILKLYLGDQFSDTVQALTCLLKY